MSLPPGGDEPPEETPHIDEPPLSESDTRPLKPLRPRPDQADGDLPAATVLQEAKPQAGRQTQRRASAPAGDTNRVRLIPRLPNPPPWRVIFVVDSHPPTTLGLDVRQALVIGRADAESDQLLPGLDLTVYLALEHGVSRQHAVLIPTAEGLYLSDLGSTNGTWVNGEFLEPGRRHSLVSGDRVELGLLRLVVRSVSHISRSATS